MRSLTCAPRNWLATFGLTILVSCSLAAPSAHALFTATEFSAGITGNPTQIAAGPDGNLWFTEPVANKIGRITPDGVVTEFSAGITPGAYPLGIAAGPDGNIWFTERDASQIGRITPDGVVTEFSANKPDFGGGWEGAPRFCRSCAQPVGIVSGPDGNLWFTGARSGYGYQRGGLGRVAKITPSGVVTEFGASAYISLDKSITVGPDGNIWASNWYSSGIARVGVSSGEVSEFWREPFDYMLPVGITAGPDGNVWFTESWHRSADRFVGGNRIGRISPTGVISEFATGITPGSNPQEIVAGPDGNLWFTERDVTQVGRITPTGVVHESGSGLSPNANMQGITVGPDGNLWVAEEGAGKIARLTITNSTPIVSVTLPSAPYLVENKAIQFRGSDSYDTDGTVASYAWEFDDGATSAAANPVHRFATQGTHSATLTVTDNQGGTGRSTSSFAITADPPPAVRSTSDLPRRIVGTDLQFDGTASDANGTIASYAWDFGDGGSAATASATHRYQAAGTYTARLTATDDDGNRNSASVSVVVAPGWKLHATEPADDAIFSSSPPRLAWDSSGGDGTSYGGAVLAATSGVPSGGSGSKSEVWSPRALFAEGPQSVALKPLARGTYFWKVQGADDSSSSPARKFTVGPDLEVKAKTGVGKTSFALSTVRLRRAQLTVPSDRAPRIKQPSFRFAPPESRYGQAEATYVWKCGNPGTHEARLSGKDPAGKTYTAKTSFKTPSCANRYKASLTKGRRKITTKQEAGFQLVDRWKHSGESYQVCVYGPKTKCFKRHTRASGTNVFHASGLPVGSYRAVWRSQGRVAGTWRFRVKAPYVAPPSRPPSRCYSTGAVRPLLIYGLSNVSCGETQRLMRRIAAGIDVYPWSCWRSGFAAGGCYLPAINSDNVRPRSFYFSPR